MTLKEPIIRGLVLGSLIPLILLSGRELDAQAAATTEQPLLVERASVRFITAQANGVEYKLYVALPEGYDSSDQRYPVVYLLDADYSFLLARQVAEHLWQRDHLAELILVGVAYAGPAQYRLNRTRDYTPTFRPDDGYGPRYQVHSGGGPEFLDFLRSELQPHIDSLYRTDPDDRTLVGHSYGGLFASYVLMTAPKSFERYIVVSPSLWYDDRLPMRLEADYAKGHRDLSAKVFFAVGDQEVNSRRSMVDDLNAFVAQLETRTYPSLRMRLRVYDDHTHNSIFPVAFTDGLRYVHNGR